MKTLTLILGKPFENVRLMFGEIQKFAECPPLGIIVFLKTFSRTTSDILKTSGNPCRRVLELYNKYIYNYVDMCQTCIHVYE